MNAILRHLVVFPIVVPLVAGALMFFVAEARRSLRVTLALTSTLVQLFLYLGYSALWSAIEDETKAARICAVLALVGAVNIPIIKFSVEWWSSLHQGESVMSGNLAGPFLVPFLVMMLGYMLLFVCLWLTRIRTMILERRVRTLMQGSP